MCSDVFSALFTVWPWERHSPEWRFLEYFTVPIGRLAFPGLYLDLTDAPPTWELLLGARIIALFISGDAHQRKHSGIMAESGLTSLWSRGSRAHAIAEAAII
jgi:hypothetical protein